MEQSFGVYCKCGQRVRLTVQIEGAPQNIAELAVTDNQQLQAVIAELQYVESVIAQHGIVAGSRCHEMLSRSIQRLTAIQ